MRALVLSAENEMPAIAEIPAPEPRANEVLVKVAACGINYADTMMRRGRYPQRPKFPFIPGFEFSGTVVRGAGPWNEGDRVMGLSAACYAEMVSAPASALMPVPVGFSDIEAAAFPVIYLTAMGMLRLSVRAGVGDSILIHAAAGGVGTASIQLAKALGLTVLATAGSDEKLALARSLGADFTANYRKASFVDPVKEFTAGRGVDIVFESIGGDWLARDIEVAAPFARIVVFGAAGGERADPPIDKMYRNSVAVSAFWLQTLLQNQEELNEVLSELIEIVEGRALRPVVGKVYPLEQGAAAWQDMESRRSIGKLLLEP
jgi:NADPH2:quinone reductase